MKKVCLYVVVEGSASGLSTKVLSAHHSKKEAKDAVHADNRRGIFGREWIPADIMALMQGGMSYIQSVHALQGVPIIPAEVEI